MAVPIALRNATVHLYCNFTRSLRKVVTMLGNQFSKSALHKWLTQHPVTRNYFSRHRPRKVTDCVESFLSTSLDCNPYQMAAALVAALRRHLHVQVSTTTVSRTIKTLGFSKKRTYARAPDTERILEARRAFCRQHPDKLPASIISVDETCLYFHSRQHSSYARRGKRLHTPLHQRRHDKYTLLLAVSNSQVVSWRLLQGSANSATSSSFVTDLEVASHHRYLLMDNVAFHKSKVVATALEAKGLVAMFTPPYSPEYNLVEMAFSVFKAHMRPMLPGADIATVADRLADMQVRVRQCAATALTEHKLSAMFRHVWRLIASESDG